MSPLALAGAWLGSGLLGTGLARGLHRHRAALLGPLVAAAAGLLVTVSISPGPLSTVGFGATMAIDRTSVGMLVAGGVACALTLALAPRIDGGEALVLGLVGAASVVALSATVPAIWAMALAVAVGALGLRWIAVTPERSTLSTGRVAGLGVAALLACVVVLPLDGTPSDTRATLSGGLLALGACALLAVVPVGGWAAAAAGAVRGPDLAVWALILAPAVLLTTAAAMPELPARGRDTAAASLLILGLLSAVYGGSMAVRAPAAARYGRLLIADLGVAAAGLGCRQEVGRLGVLLIVLSHLATGPLLLHAPRPGLQRPHRLAWLALSGLPLSAAFWGRLLVLEALAATSPVALVIGLLASATLLSAAMRALVAGETAEGSGAPFSVRGVGWLLALGGLALGFAPAWMAARVFGVDLGAG